jgi:hypothetical protein
LRELEEDTVTGLRKWRREVIGISSGIVRGILGGSKREC